jgi:hypothetical protein
MDASTLANLVEQRLGDLRNKSIADLLVLPECTEDAVKIDGKDVKLSTFHEIVDGKHRVVLQAIRERWGGMMAKVIARGFEIEGDKQLRALTAEELYNFT